MTFKKGDKVKIIANTNGSCNKIGDIGVVASNTTNGYGSFQVEVPNRFGGNWTRPSDMILIEDDIYENEWHLNDGKVTIPDDAHKLMDGGSVVAFRKRKVKDLEFGDELVGRVSGTKYRFIRYTNHLKTHCDVLNSANEIAREQSLTTHLKRV